MAAQHTYEEEAEQNPSCFVAFIGPGGVKTCIFSNHMKFNLHIGPAAIQYCSGGPTFLLTPGCSESQQIESQVSNWKFKYSKVLFSKQLLNIVLKERSRKFRSFCICIY